MKKILALITISLTLFLVECKKYPEGPAISFRSKKERIANTWQLTKYIENGTDKTSDFNTVFTDYTLVTTKGGDYTITYKLANIAMTETGTWELSSDKEDLTFIRTSPNTAASKWQILKLYEKELWGRNIDDNGNIKEFHLTPR